MSIPKRIPVKYIPDYYTSNIGRYDGDKQFWAKITATFAPESAESSSKYDWTHRKRWYAVLHLFDAEGKHLETKYEFIGRTSDGEQAVIERARQKRSEFLASLGAIELGDIAVQLFQLKIDGSIFGLIDESDDESAEIVVSEPDDLVFYAPWNGEYDT